MRGLPTPFAGRMHRVVTIHPSYLLRIPDEAHQRAEYSAFRQGSRGREGLG